MPGPLCDVCHDQLATVFVTKIVNNETTRQRLCESCARQRAAGEGWIQHLKDATGTTGDIPLEEIVMNLFEQADAALDGADENTEETNGYPSPGFAIPFNLGEFPADEDLIDEMEDAAGLDDLSYTDEIMQDPPKSDIFAATPTPRTIPSVRCSKCAMTWDRLRQDGRVGCAHCYIVFADQLRDVIQRVQHSSEHIGKTPRAAQKRKRRLEYLRARRDHRLDMLKKRLQEAVAAERYEDAAKLRDKIKIVSSTIVSNE